MKKIHLFPAIVFIISALFMASCACEECPTCPAEQNDIMVMEFQNGVWPNASYAGCEDTVINPANPTTNYSAATTLYFGQTGGTTTQRALINFDISAIVPTNAVIVNAYLTFRHNGYTSYTDSYSANEMTRVWIGSQATWNNYLTSSSWTAPGGDFNPVANNEMLPNATSDYIIFTIGTDIIKSWLLYPYLSKGLMFKSSVEDGNEHMMYAYSSNHATPAYRPKLTVYYRLP